MAIKIEELSRVMSENKKAIKEIKDSLRPPKERDALKIGTWPICIYHAAIKPNYKSKTILTDSTWEYVNIYLKQNSNKSTKHKNAQFYWQQARNFYSANQLLDKYSKPLTSYYCFLNATKALLEIKNVPYSFSHGVAGRGEKGHSNIKNEYVRLKLGGVLSGLCNYLNEPVIPKSKTEPHEEYSLKDVFYNLAYIHRSYSLTYTNMAELFIPILNPRFVQRKDQKRAWFEFKLEKEHSNKTNLTRLSSLGYELEVSANNNEIYTVRKKKRFKWDVVRNQPDTHNLTRLDNYLFSRRRELQYIYSSNELWYLKRKDLTSTSIIDRNPLVLTYAAMHRLSELARYQPNVLRSHLDKDASWLLNEFIDKSIVQFIDQISSEITGNQFRVTGFRS